MRRTTIIVTALLCLVFVTAGLSQNIEYVSSTLWSGMYDIEVVGDYAYCAFANGLVIFDVTDPTSPIFISQLYCQGKGRAIAIAHDHVYLADDFGGIQIINVFDVENPVFVRNLPYELPWDYEIQVYGNCLYFLCPDSVLQVFDITNPATPIRSGSYQASSKITRFCVSGNYAYLLRSYEVEILDISQPSNPISIANYATECVAKDIKVVGNRAYLIESGYENCGKFEILELPEHANPFAIGGCDITRNIMRIYASENNVYISSYSTESYTTGFFSIDISNPDSLIFPGGYYSQNSLCCMYATNSFLYACFDNNMLIFDLTRARHPTCVATFDLPPKILNLSISDESAFLSVGRASYGYTIEMRAVNIANPCNPLQTGRCRFAGWGLDFCAQNNCAYVSQKAYSSESWSGLQVIDVPNDTDPVLAGSCQTDYEPWGVYVEGNFAYLALTEDYYWDNGALQIIDVNDPDNPVLAGRLNIQAGVLGVFAAGNYAYFTEDSGNLDAGSFNILDVSDPYYPILRSIYILNNPREIFVEGNYAYIVDISTGLIILDVSDPLDPVLAGSFLCDHIESNVFISDGYAFVGKNNELLVLDVSNPEEPVLAKSYAMPDLVVNIFVNDEYVYLANTSSFMIMRFSPVTVIGESPVIPSHFSLSKNYPNPFNPSTTIEYELARQAEVRIDIYDILGRKVTTLVDTRQQAGYHRVIWRADDLPSGIYLYKLQAGDYSESKKMLLIK